MDAQTFAIEAVVEETHWWFVGRRRLFAAEIARLGLPADADVLDVGTSTGTNLRMLREQGYRNVAGLDSSAEAARWCMQKGLGNVRQGDVCALPYSDSTFDLVLATDVIEHVERDDIAVQELQRVLKPGGYALITVPAFQCLWGLQDEVAHHKRRYRMRPLLRLIEASGLGRVHSYHFNFLLFLPIWSARRIIGLSGKRLRSENELNSPLINAILSAIFRLDLVLARWLHVPFGVSALVVARKER